MTKIEVTQEDREAVCEHARNKWQGETIEEAFARYRQKAYEKGFRDGRQSNG